ncbi:hypothetical protein ACLQ18_15970 [Streptomyces sp. DT193]|uniref:hypothetical protein n=1 Tax=Streptomyces sp. DT193 TaxID=3393418 RepID=UPI003CEE8569
MTAIPSDDLAAAFARLGGEDDRQVWSELWDDLYHQPRVGSDSLTALPYLAEIADGRAPGEPDEAVELAGLIASAADHEHCARYAEELAVLLPVARRLLEAARESAVAFVDLLQCVLALEGERVWSTGLLEGLYQREYEIECPKCTSELFIAFGDRGTFASAGDYVTSDPAEAALLPADPAALTPLPTRLHRTAAQAGHEDIARGITYLFGRATCPDCGDVFPVEDQVEASRI